jgi:hypothetical protein
LSCSEVARAADEAAKEAVLADRDAVTTDNLVGALRERREIGVRNQPDVK